ncbi:potassium voltage-gated channel subfamily F member 1-like [Liolophura sinensis]|uniref:potassium voltage-gated channel subfamily F member 1-like n=1 Tax=Liolophura sinensis TaxID=3198878 RepID=UPI0031583FFC
MDSEIVKVSVNGRRYEVPKSLIDRPLKQAKTGGKNYRQLDDGHYYFARHVGCFEAALDYLNLRELHMPQDVCPSVFIREMEFWGVDVNEMKNCCKMRMDIFLEEVKILDSMNKEETPSTINKGTWRGFFHESLEEPHYSVFGQIYFWLSMVFVLLAVIALCAETMPQFRHKLSKEEWKEFLGDKFHSYENLVEEKLGLSKSQEEDDFNTTANFSVSRKPHQGKLPPHLGGPMPSIHLLSLACGIFFSVDLLFRFGVYVNRRRFLSSPLNLIDTVAVIAFFSRVVLVAIFPELKYTSSYMDFISAISTVRVFRVFRLVGQCSGLRVFLFSLRAGFREIWLLVLLLGIGVLMFSSLFYFCERPTENIESIPAAFWWAIITMTTVGYGDTVPRSLLGKILGSVCAISGVIVMAVTVPIFASKFALYYHRVGRCRSVTGNQYKPFRRYSSFVKPMPEYGSQKDS